jgi:hypothetical protein
MSDIVVLVAPPGSNVTSVPLIANLLNPYIDRLGSCLMACFIADASGPALARVANLRPVAVLDWGVLDPESRAQLRAAGTVIVPDFDLEGVSPSAYFTAAIGRLQAEHLGRCGYQRILYVDTETERDTVEPHRVSAIRQYCEDHGLEFGGQLGVSLSPSEAAKSITQHLLPPTRTAPALDSSAADGVVAKSLGPAARPGPPLDMPAANVMPPDLGPAPRTGLACSSVLVASAALAGLAKLDVAVPDQVGVIGWTAYGPSAAITQEALTTITVDNESLAESIAGALAADLSGAEPPPQDPPLLTLIQGGSTRPIQEASTPPPSA